MVRVNNLPNLHGFETQLIETTKCIPTVINEMRDAHNLYGNRGEKDESL
jgi:hypothetical protein